MRWAVVVPVKRLSQAKSRLGEQAGFDRVQLALAFAADTVAAARAVDLVDLIVVVTSDEEVRRSFAEDVRIVEEPPAAGLDEALAAGVATARSLAPAVGVAGLVADLPALRPHDLSRALQAAAEHPCAVVADASGTGTTMLTVLPGRVWGSSFGPGSAALHVAAGAFAIEGALESLRRDVDTESDLAAAQGLGVGVATASILEGRPAGSTVDVQATVRDFDEGSRAGSAITDGGQLIEIPAGSLVGARLLRGGQRVVIRLRAGRPETVTMFGAPHL